METNNLQPKFLTSSIAYLVSETLERASYYGLRAILLMYMISEFGLDNERAFFIYGVFMGVLLIAQIIGAVFGDLLLGNKTMAIIGGFLQTIGAFVICIPNTFGLYTGIGLAAFGAGIYTPNVFALFGKLFKPRDKIADSGFTLFYAAISLGAFIGALIMAGLADISFTYGFICVGIFSLLSTILLFFGHNAKEEANAVLHNTPLTNRGIIILITIFVISLFWISYDFGGSNMYEMLSIALSETNTSIASSSFMSVNSVATFVFALIAVVAWYFLSLSRFIKMGIGFVFAILSFGLMLVIPSAPGASGLVVYIISILFLTLAEVLIAPIGYAIILKHINPKYLALIFACLMAPIYGFSYIQRVLPSWFYEESGRMIAVAIPLLLVGALAVFITPLILKDHNSEISQEQ